MRQGFSLVELMVVVAVVMVLTGIGAVSLNSFNQSQELDSKKEELISDLKLARNMAITNQLPGGSIDLKYVKVILNSGVGISVDAILADSGETELSYFSKENKVINVSNSFGFSIENGRLMKGNGEFESNPFCLTLFLNANPDDKKYVTIDTSGLIYEKNSCP